MIELFDQDVRTIDRQSSKGNQLKWESRNVWYKADYTGYEGLSEYMVSHLLAKSDLNRELLVMYEPETIRYREQILNGVKSENFLREDWQIVTLEKLFRQFFGSSLHEAVWHIRDHKERLTFLVDQVKRITGLQEFGKYMNQVLTIDAFFLNEDRHTHNLAVLMNGKGEFKYCPVFDHGAALLSDTTMDYPLSVDVYELMDKVQAKTFSPDFEEQLEISEELYGNNLHFSFTTKYVDELLSGIEKADGGYSPEIIRRVRTLLHERIRIFPYLFERP